MTHPDDDIWLIPREEQTEAFCYAVNGLTYKQIAKEQGMPADSVKSRIKALYDKLLVYSDPESLNPCRVLTVAACKAIRIGLIRYNYEQGGYEPSPDFKMEGKVRRQSDLFRNEGPYRCPSDHPVQRRERMERAVARRMEQGFTEEAIQKAKEALLSTEFPPDSQIIIDLLQYKHYTPEFWAMGKSKLEGLKQELRKSHPELMREREEAIKKREVPPDHPWRQQNRAGYEEYRSSQVTGKDLEFRRIARRSPVALVQKR
ncbi:hypothetical protein PJF56_16840 [Roseofilum sp. BLCC_M91]|uniref:RNA polymerase sigma factor 70 region 4 type 2 domain-containing protein n=1 Tax=Roseofilum halophilum BLCC-M91 TaxID=3022259 RepID=A0ABT7BPR9_9CYAN|nr:hypothetical protein [Roseofilum halophilum]MDJ1180529.1 hypothetical protein [Roseofilum halophilum BLCC-M91]